MLILLIPIISYLLQYLLYHLIKDKNKHFDIKLIIIIICKFHFRFKPNLFIYECMSS